MSRLVLAFAGHPCDKFGYYGFALINGILINIGHYSSAEIRILLTCLLKCFS